MLIIWKTFQINNLQEVQLDFEIILKIRRNSFCNHKNVFNSIKKYKLKKYQYPFCILSQNQLNPESHIVKKNVKRGSR